MTLLSLSQSFLDATLKVDANLMGISKQPERWHKCVAATKAALPSITDKLFIDNFFSEDDRQIALTMLDYIRAAFKQTLMSVEWMSEESRTAALEKLHNIFFECGHPVRAVYVHTHTSYMYVYYENLTIVEGFECGPPVRAVYVHTYVMYVCMYIYIYIYIYIL